jgi:eukaryotic-like serine/threonine-protein kinase
MAPSRDPACPRCGATLAAETVPQGLCPSCLLTTALSSDDERPAYRILTPIGGDPLGVTYLAEAASGPFRYVALKVAGPRGDVDAIMSRFRRWQEALARIHHPGVQRLLEVAPMGPAHLRIVAEYVVGTPLATLAAQDPSRIPDRVAVARQLAEAIDAAHAQNVIHLKLDASRVRIATAGGRVARILGFGTGLILDGLSGSPAEDVRALVKVIGDLGINLPQSCETVAAVRAALDAR